MPMLLVSSYLLARILSLQGGNLRSMFLTLFLCLFNGLSNRVAYQADKLSVEQGKD